MTRVAVRVVVSLVGVAAAVAGLSWWIDWELAPHAGSRPSGTPPAVVVDGHRVPFAAMLAWSDPTLSADGREVRIVTRLNALPERTHVCIAAATRVVVRQDSATQVQIGVAGYGTPASTGGCPSIDVSPTHLTVELAAPLGSRQLVDMADHGSRPVASG